MGRTLVFGLAQAGEATATALVARGHDVVAADDEATDDRAETAAGIGVDWAGAPDPEELARLVAAVDLVVPAPGVPEGHELFEHARRAGVEVVSEIELAYRWEAERPGGPRPIVAVTGTDGKTTTTLMAVAMLRAGGLRTVDAGNTQTPLVSALDLDLDAFVVECTSFRLAWTSRFRPDAAAWLNLAPDHLDWHRSLDSYVAAKARIWAAQRHDDVAVGFVDDPTVMRELAKAPGRHRTFGLTGADYRLDEVTATLTGPAGRIVARDAMRRSLPHDVTNALAAAALVLETGLAGEDAVGTALAEFVGPPHRLELVARLDGVEWYNDSKATTPHAARAAIAALGRVVLIAGGYDKHVDLAPMAAEASSVRAVIALGATRERIAEIFAGVGHVELVDSMEEAVDHAAALADAGDVVLLSPGCASFGLYRNFEARGEHFRQLVAARTPAAGRGTPDVDGRQEPIQ